MATVGKNILDNLTTGMYADSKVIYIENIFRTLVTKLILQLN